MPKIRIFTPVTIGDTVYIVSPEEKRQCPECGGSGYKRIMVNGMRMKRVCEKCAAKTKTRGHVADIVTKMMLVNTGKGTEPEFEVLITTKSFQKRDVWFSVSREPSLPIMPEREEIHDTVCCLSWEQAQSLCGAGLRTTASVKKTSEVTVYVPVLAGDTVFRIDCGDPTEVKDKYDRIMRSYYLGHRPLKDTVRQISVELGTGKYTISTEDGKDFTQISESSNSDHDKYKKLLFKTEEEAAKTCEEMNEKQAIIAALKAD